MQRTIYECDKCDSEVSGRRYLHSIKIENSNSYSVPISLELCSECREQIIEWTKER